MQSLLHVEQIAARLGVPVGTVRHWRNSGQLAPVFRLHGLLVCHEEELEEWIEEQRQIKRVDGRTKPTSFAERTRVS